MHVPIITPYLNFQSLFLTILICLCLEIKSEQDVKLLILKKANYWPKTHEKIIVKIDDNSSDRKPKPFTLRAAEKSELIEADTAENVPRKYQRHATPIPVQVIQPKVKQLKERHGESAIDKFFRSQGTEVEGTDATQPVQPLNINTQTFKKTKARKDKPRDPAKGNKYHSRIRNEESHEMPSFEVAHDRKKQKKKLKLEKLPNPLPQKGTDQWPETTGIDNLGGYYEENAYATHGRPKFSSNVKQSKDFHDELPKYLYKSEIFYPSHRYEEGPAPPATHVFHHYSPKKTAPISKPTVTIPEPKSHKNHNNPATSYAAVSNGNSGWKPIKHLTNHGGYQHRDYGHHEIQSTSAPDFSEDHENGRYHHTGKSHKADHSGKENQSAYEEEGGDDEDYSEEEDDDQKENSEEDESSSEYESESKNTPKKVSYNRVKAAPVLIPKTVPRRPEYKPMYITNSTVQPPRNNQASRPPYVVMSDSQEADRPRKVEHPTVIKISTKSKNTSPKDDLKYFQ